MRTHFYYSTFATALITTCRGNVYEREFYECHELQWFYDWAKSALEEDMIEIPSKIPDTINKANIFIKITTIKFLICFSPIFCG